MAGAGSDRAPSPVVFPGLPRRIAAGGVARWKRRIYVLGGENGSRFYDSIYCWKPGWRSWVQRREKLPGDTGGVSQFGCTTLKFPKKHILNRLRAAKENCKKNTHHWRVSDISEKYLETLCPQALPDMFSTGYISLELTTKGETLQYIQTSHFGAIVADYWHQYEEKRMRVLSPLMLLLGKKIYIWKHIFVLKVQ